MSFSRPGTPPHQFIPKNSEPAKDRSGRVIAKPEDRSDHCGKPESNKRMHREPLPLPRFHANRRH